MPKEISTQSKFKKFLGLKRDEKVDYRLISKIEPLFKDISFTVCGDHTYTPPSKHLNVNIKLIDGHYELANNPGRENIKGVHFKEVNKDCIWFYIKQDKNMYKIYNGCITRVISYEEFVKLKKNFNNFVMKAKDDVNYKDEYNQFMYDSELLKNATDGKINLFKYSRYSLAAIDVWRRFSKLYNYSEPLLSNESSIINKAFLGGLLYAEKYTGYGITYDINSFYPSLMTNRFFQVPVEQGESMRLSEEEFNSMTYFKYGIYRAIVDKSNNKLFKYNYRNFYTHFDLMLAKELGLKISIIIDNEFNFYYYSKEKLVKGEMLFKPFVDYLYDLKEKEYRGAKKILNTLWGALCAKNKYSRIVKDADEEFNIPDNGKIISVVMDGHKAIKVSYLSDVNKLFKRPEARFGCFLTSYGRLMLARQLVSHVDKIVRIHTDGIIFNSNCDHNFNIGTGLGEWKIEYESYMKIYHVNWVEKLTKFKYLVIKYYDSQKYI
jgi:hypothetical protein